MSSAMKTIAEMASYVKYIIIEIKVFIYLRHICNLLHTSSCRDRAGGSVSARRSYSIRELRAVYGSCRPSEHRSQRRSLREFWG